MSKDSVVFSFSLSDLNKTFGRSRSDQRKKQSEEEFLKTKFEEWDLPVTDAVAEVIVSVTKEATDPDSTGELVTWADKLGSIFKSLQLSTSQIRNIFGTVRQIEMGWGPADTEEEREKKRKQATRRLLLLKPKLAYQARREKAVEGLAKVLSAAIDFVGGRDDFQRFTDFFEAILAYHTAAGGQ